MFRRASIAAALFCCVTSAGALAANPVYDSWAKHKPGTSVTAATASEASGMKNDIETVTTLKEVTPEKVVVEMKMSMSVMGNKTEMPAQTMEIPAAASATATPGNPAGQAPAADSKTSEEKVTVAGKEYAATCTQSKSDQNGMKSETKVWTSPEVPGMTLKMETTTTGQMASTTKMQVTKIELK